MANKKLIRPAQGGKIAGVCAGLANYIGMDVTLLRVIYALLTIFTAFAGILVYIILALVVPKEV